MFYSTSYVLSRLYLDDHELERHLIDCLNLTVENITVKRFYISFLFFSFHHWALSSKQCISGDINCWLKSNFRCNLLLSIPRKLTVFTEGSLPSCTTSLVTALQLIQLDPHLSTQFLPNDPSIHPKENQNFEAKFISSEKIG